MKFLPWLCFFIIVKVNGQYVVPELKLEAFSPKGFRASMPADELDQLFVFNGKKGIDPLAENEPGEFSGEIKKKTRGYFVYDNPSLALNVGDEIHYTVYVQHDNLGYKKNDRSWVVKELLKAQTSTCENSISLVSGSVLICKDSTVFEDDFKSSSVNEDKWLVEQYIPDEPDYEFVIYKKDKDVVLIRNNQLIIKPKLQDEKDIFESTIDISDGCTRAVSKQARCKGRIYLLHNPVISGRLVSKTTFSYADFEVKAKLPSGEWMYPEIYLEDENYNRLVIAYSRGNKIFTGNDGTDIGGSLLFGGPMLSPIEPTRSKKLSSYRHKTGPLSDDFHIYRMRWTPEKIELFIDGQRYGAINSTDIPSFGYTSKPPVRAHLVIGIGVGGINDFPNDFKSGDVLKPWKNRNNVQVKMFYESRSQWLPSWNNGGQLIVDYVKVKAI
ncbi:beta-1,3-glucan-binding protein-like [Diorhabda carinulata]|uniref:beta-1,3-glucan-binding protein-like n=1 Tax=Diorhabda carinulata TaxID=1163345 RepID=UPI0025A1E355|nr:beta-1,3-glucan-binding protein-like [Diorhabda carinulata]